jgi:hypothetical protein
MLWIVRSLKHFTEGYNKRKAPQRLRMKKYRKLLSEKESIMNISKFLIIGMLATCLVMMTAPPAGAQVDLTTDPSGLGSATINGAIWEILHSTDPTGSGVFYSFLRVQKTPTERGYNTDGRPLQFDENTSASFTHSFHLKDVPQINIGGTIYREFQLDLNEKNSNPDWYISLDSFQVWTTNDQNLLGYTEASPSGTFPTGDTLGHALLVYDLDGAGDTWIKMDYRANNGSGKRDYRVYVPESDFDGKTLEYVVLFTRHGAQGGQWISDSGYEEWGVAQYPATKAGYKFNDENGNGVWDVGELGLNGWTINLVGTSIDDKGHTHAVSMSTVTADDGDGNPGYYSFSVPQGNYTVSEVMQPGWAQTFPGGGGTYVISLGNGDLDLDNNFGNVQYNPDISITKSADIDDFCLSDAPAPVTYTYLVENTGNEPLENVDVTDDKCSSPTYQSGDDGDDDILSPGEIWTYQCTTVLNDATTNTGTVVAYGVITGTEVTDSDTAFVDAIEFAVEVDPAEATICNGSSQEFCAVVTLGGSGNYTYLWSTGETTECIDADVQGDYSVTVTDTGTGCVAEASAHLTVVNPPVCSIDGEIEVCDIDSEIKYCSLNSADSYSWSIDEGGDAEIVGATDGQCVYVNPTGPGSFTLRLLVCNGPVELNCCSECTLNVTVNPCEPGIHVEKYPDITDFCLSDIPVEVTYTYEVTANGTEPLKDVSLEDLDCTPVRQADDPGNNDDILGLDEVWVYKCTTTLSDTTTNTVDAFGTGVNSEKDVTDETTATVTAHDVDVEVNPSEAEICAGGDPAEFCAVPDLGSGNYSYSWSKDGGDSFATTQCIKVSEAGEYCVTIHDNDTGCEDTACATLTVIDIPECSIEGPPSLCVGDQVQFCASVSNADSYVWVIALGSEYAEIVGDDTGNCVTVHATGEGTFRLGLDICNSGDVISCCNECSIDVPIEPCGGAFCTFTQGFYGNKGGKACGLKTANLIDILLGYGDVVVGVPGHSITLGSSDCIIDLLPAGGTATVLPEGDFVCDKSTNTIPASLLTEFSKKDSRFNNVLIGQIVALTLNLRLYSIDCMGGGGTGDLAGWTLPEEFCTMGKDGCAKKHITPDAFVGMEVGAILALANEVIAGEDVGVSPSEINDVVDFINETFDGCKEIVTCPTVEICNNGCDDDFDGLVDCADPDCYGVGDCPTPTP